jgi:hypothetical protein
MAEELKGNVFELRRTCSLSAKPLFPHVFPERGHVPGSAAHAARLISHGVKGLLDACVDDPREAHGTGLKRGVKNKPFHPPGILLFPVFEPLTFDLVFIAIQEIHLRMQITAEVWGVLPVVTGFHDLPGPFADQASTHTAVSFMSSSNSLAKGHQDVWIIRIPRVRDIGLDTLLNVFEARKGEGHVLGKGSQREQEQTKSQGGNYRLPTGTSKRFHNHQPPIMLNS